MKSVKAVLLSGALFTAGTNAAWYRMSEVNTRYTEVWKETFTGTTLNRNNWHVAHDCWGGGNQEDQCYVDREGTGTGGTFHVNNGLFIHPDRNPGTQAQALSGKTCTETSTDLSSAAISARCGPAFESVGKVLSAKVRSKVGFNPYTSDGRQGRVEVYAKLPTASNGDYSWQWPAIWMLPFSETANSVHYMDWPNRGEIDIVEGMDASGKISAATHYRKNYDWNWPFAFIGGPSSSVATDRSQYHTFAVTWDSFGLVYSVDDTIIANHTIDQLGVSQQYFFQPGNWHLIINYAIFKGKGDAANAALANSGPFEIKSVRFLRENTATLGASSLTSTDITNLQRNPAVRTHVCVRPGSKSFFILPTGTCPTGFNKWPAFGCPTLPWTCSSGGKVCNRFDITLYRDASNNCVAPYDPAVHCNAGCGLDQVCPQINFGCFNSAGARCISDFSVQLVRDVNMGCIAATDPSVQCPVGCTLRGV